jgi:protein involved in polysaccharide export with SLBB domain
LIGDEDHNIPLRNEDSVVIYPDSQFHPQYGVSVYGAVHNPGTYLRHDSMTVSDLVLLAGGLLEGAVTSGWELSRLDTTEINTYTHVVKVDIGSDYWNADRSSEIMLTDFDVLMVPFDPRSTPQKFVEVAGYVMYPGRYSIRREGERLSEILARAGGMRSGAYLEGSRLFRRFNNAGLVPINFREAVEDIQSRDNIVLYEGDSIHVAFLEDVVYVSGEVYVPSPVLYKEGADLDYYIEQAGGFKEDAEEGSTVAFLPGGKKWEDGEILPGSSVFVPRKIDKPDTTLATIASLATVLASLAAMTASIVAVSR